MSFRRRGPAPQTPLIDFCMSCLAIGFHRWDCTKVDRKYRADGPYGPLVDPKAPIELDVQAVAALAYRTRRS